MMLHPTQELEPPANPARFKKTTDDMLLEIMIEDAKNFEDILPYLAHCKERLVSEENEETQPTYKASDEERVSLATIHAAKGREWSSVCLFDASRPSRRKETNPKDLEEERRVFYVGMTRASQHLQIAFVRGRAVQFIEEAILPPGVAPSSLDDFQRLLAGAAHDVDKTISRVDKLGASLELVQGELHREKDGSRLRSELAKLDAMGSDAEQDLATARRAMTEATSLKIGGVLGRMFFGRVRPETKSEMMASALSMVRDAEQRIEDVSHKKQQALKNAAERERRLLQENERIREELHSTRQQLELARQKVADLKRARPLFDE
jgi:ATP-dependent exoDNAse (exonuclease V) beta subunit